MAHMLPVISGHEQVEKRLAHAVFMSRLPSAYLFCGQQGIGKAIMAQMMAASLLAPASPDDDAHDSLFGDALPKSAPVTLQYQPEILSKMMQGSHPDYLMLRPVYDERKKRYKPDITVDQVRQIGDFLSLTAGEAEWKVIVIDPVDALNVNAVNALLKWLEEPPAQSIFILISHKPSTLLPTVLSRCQHVPFAPLPWTPYSHMFAPEADETTLKQLYRFTGGAPGTTRQWLATDWQGQWNGWLDYAMLLAPTHQQHMQAFMKQWQKQPAMLDYMAIFCASLVQRISVYLATGTTKHVADTPQEAEAIAAIATRYPPHIWHQRWTNFQKLTRDSKKLYLDGKAVMIDMLSLFH